MSSAAALPGQGAPLPEQLNQLPSHCHKGKQNHLRALPACPRAAAGGHAGCVWRGDGARAAHKSGRQDSWALSSSGRDWQEVLRAGGQEESGLRHLRPSCATTSLWDHVAGLRFSTYRARMSTLTSHCRTTGAYPASVWEALRRCHIPYNVFIRSKEEEAKPHYLLLSLGTIS